jgi:hypothetical protein
MSAGAQRAIQARFFAPVLSRVNWKSLISSLKQLTELSAAQRSTFGSLFEFLSFEPAFC